MPVEHIDWLIGHFPRFNVGDDAAFTTRYLRRLRVEARRRFWSEVELLEWVEAQARTLGANPTIMDPVTRS
jgi:hypothetical protein